jgi:hypothetical protein
MRIILNKGYLSSRTFWKTGIFALYLRENSAIFLHRIGVKTSKKLAENVRADGAAEGSFRDFE